jgi:hypothetical protein
MKIIARMIVPKKHKELFILFLLLGQAGGQEIRPGINGIALYDGNVSIDSLIGNCSMDYVTSAYTYRDQGDRVNASKTWEDLGNKLFDSRCTGSLKYAVDAYLRSREALKEEWGDAYFYREISRKYINRSEGSSAESRAEYLKYAALFSAKAGDTYNANELSRESLKYYDEAYNGLFDRGQVKSLEIYLCFDKECNKRKYGVFAGETSYIGSTLYLAGVKVSSLASYYSVSPVGEKKVLGSGSTVLFKTDSYGTYRIVAENKEYSIVSSKNISVQNPFCDEDNICDSEEDCEKCPQDCICEGPSGKKNTETQGPISDIGQYIPYLTLLMIIIAGLVIYKRSKAGKIKKQREESIKWKEDQEKLKN